MKNLKVISCRYKYLVPCGLFIFFIVSCKQKNNKIETYLPVKIKAQEIIKYKSVKPLIYSKHVNVYQYYGQDSVLNGEIWFQGDSIIREDKQTHFFVPMRFENWDYVINNINAHGVLETFVEDICEVGGNSAWNKYNVILDSLQRPIEIKHYKAWWYEGLIDSLGNEKKRKKYPEYFLASTFTYVYSHNYESEKTIHYEYNKETKTEKFYDDQGRLSCEIYTDNDEKFKNIYSYLKQ